MEEQANKVTSVRRLSQGRKQYLPTGTSEANGGEMLLLKSSVFWYQAGLGTQAKEDHCESNAFGRQVRELASLLPCPPDSHLGLVLAGTAWGMDSDVMQSRAERKKNLATERLRAGIDQKVTQLITSTGLQNTGRKIDLSLIAT